VKIKHSGFYDPWHYHHLLGRSFGQSTNAMRFVLVGILYRRSKACGITVSRVAQPSGTGRCLVGQVSFTSTPDPGKLHDTLSMYRRVDRSLLEGYNTLSPIMLGALCLTPLFRSTLIRLLSAYSKSQFSRCLPTTGHGCNICTIALRISQPGP